MNPVYVVLIIATCSTLLGPAIAPLMGGYIAQYLGWRWIFYISTMIGGVILVADVLIMRETLYNPSALEEEKPKTLRERLNYLKFNPVCNQFTGLKKCMLIRIFTVSRSFTAVTSRYYSDGATNVRFFWMFFLFGVRSCSYVFRAVPL